MSTNKTVESNQSITLSNDIFFVYTSPSIAICGVFLQLMTLAVFSRKEFDHGLYKYLRVQIIFEMLDLIVPVIRPIHDCNTCGPISASYGVQLYFLLFVIYFAGVFEQSAILSQILSSLYFFLFISNKLNSNRNNKLIDFLYFKRFKLVCFLMFAYSCFLFCYQFFQYKIIARENNAYALVGTEFNNSLAKSVLEILTFCLRDGLGLILVIGINIMIFARLKKAIREKNKLHNYAYTLTTDTNNNNNYVSKSKTDLEADGPSIILQKAQELANKPNAGNKEKRIQEERALKFEKKTSIMFGFMFFNYIMARLPIFLFFILRNLFSDSDFVNFYFIRFAVFQIYFFYSISFFFYFFSNKIFRKVFISFFSSK